MAKTVPETEKTFLRPGFFFVAPRTADAAIETKFFNGREQGGGLQLVAADDAGFRRGDAFGNRIVHRANDELRAELFRATVAEIDQFGKFVARLNVKERHRNVRRPKRLFRETQQADGILAAGEQERGAFKFRRHFTHDVNGLCFQKLQMVEMITAHWGGG